MTTTLERTPRTLTGDTAFEIIERYRHAFDDRTDVVDLGDEFPALARQLGRGGLYLARLDRNIAGSFKWRGALVEMALQMENGESSFVAPSAGNHVTGAFHAGAVLGAEVHGAFPRSAPDSKKRPLFAAANTHANLYAHEVGDIFDDTEAWVRSDATDYGHLLHPFDSRILTMGQGTVVDDIRLHFANIDHLLLPVGGGGLLAGVTRRLGELGLSTKVHAVEAEGSDSLSRSVRAGRRVHATSPNQLFGGSAVGMTGYEALDAVLDDPKRVVFHTASTRRVQDVAREYVAERQFDAPLLEPTTLAAVALVETVSREYPSENVVVLGTGHKAPLERLLAA